ncbi:hypothetical protein AVEN_210675-1 [Araneus ventricosus]|uniref:Uncharacterized protein n=1 Tax=Araneus ventricosus TaxID=182803 RepID=A0A4Y2U2C9_ARAVE|nr:hypothetical protein AVEN_214017-1 [Araneus ventricosus]GBO06133.1 hypothetical protein AVEN_269234-1 [Araneus ventricosus]GBO06134.1 hypothetical protein AVEN_138184-1 [Araneus ventricosus]GBO06137.1 hypothetical protein AVEN_210675-1 [Araneus ventricosus]
MVHSSVSHWWHTAFDGTFECEPSVEYAGVNVLSTLTPKYGELDEYYLLRHHNLRSRGDSFLLVPLKPGGSDNNWTLPTCVVIYPHNPRYNLPLRRREMDCGSQG